MENLLLAMHHELSLHRETDLTVWVSLLLVLPIYVVKETLLSFQN